MQTNSKKTTAETHPQFSELYRKTGEPNKWYYQVQRGDTIEKINQRFYRQEERQLHETAEPNHRKPIDGREFWEPLFVGEELCIIVEPFVAIEVTELSQSYPESLISRTEAEQFLLDLASPIDYRDNIRDLSLMYQYASQYMLRNDITDPKSVASLEMIPIFINALEACATAK